MSDSSFDLTALTDEDLHARHRATAAEIERRHRIRMIPEQVSELGSEWRRSGEDVTVLVNALNNPEKEPEPTA